MTVAVTSPVSRSLDAYRASGVSIDAPKLADRWRLEDEILAGIACLDQIMSTVAAWRDRVVRGRQAYDPADDETYRRCLEQWIEITRSQVEPAVRKYEDVWGFNAVSNTEQIRTGLLTAEKAVKGWDAPVASKYASFRDVELTADESAAFEAVAKAPRPPAKFRRIGQGG